MLHLKRLSMLLLLFAGGCTTVTAPDHGMTRTTSAPMPATAAPVPPAQAAPVVESRPLTWSQVAAINDDRLIDVYPGMNQKVVEERMQLHSAGRPINPFRQELLRDQQGKIYSVLFYLTREPVKGRPINERFLTPVIFRNDRVEAVGRYPLKKLRASACRLARGHCLPAGQPAI